MTLEIKKAVKQAIANLDAKGGFYSNEDVKAEAERITGNDLPATIRRTKDQTQPMMEYIQAERLRERDPA